jgi:hypothetical protein
MLLLYVPDALAYQQSEDSLSTSVSSTVDELQSLEEDEFQSSEMEEERRMFLFVDMTHPTFMLWFLITVIIIAIIGQLITLTWILITRNKIQSDQKKRSEFMERYQTLLVDYLFSEDDEDLFNEIKQIAKSEFNRKILIDQVRIVLMHDICLEVVSFRLNGTKQIG